ncbi:MAG: serine acetyltransferase [Nannocystaceae bacterium]|nr:serine acetyltransferase [Nannocystaceae bacterium]
MTQAPDPRALARAIDDVVASYALHGNINHLDGANLPSRALVSQLLEDLLSIVFPGYFVEDQVDALTCRYFAGERCARVLRGLEHVVARAFAADGAATLDVSTARAQAVAIEVIQEIPTLRELLDTDVQAALAGDPAAGSASEIIMSYPGIEAIAVHRIAHTLHTRGVPLIPRMMSEWVHRQTGIDIHPGAVIGPSFFIDHGTGVVVGETSRIGARVKLYQGVTLGAMSVSGRDAHARRKRHPTIEDDVTIYAGATILGGDTVIGAGSIVGGNVWLTHSLPPGTTVMLDKPSLRFIAQDG